MWERVVRFCHFLFIVAIPSWEIRDLLISSLHGPGQILAWQPRCFLEWLHFVILTLSENISRPVWVGTPCRSELDHLSGETLAEDSVSYSLACLSGSTVRLVSPLWNKWRSGRLGSQTPQDSSCLVCFGGSSAIYTKMMWERVVRFLSLLFIVAIPSWEIRDPLISSLHGPGQILAWQPRCFLEWLLFV